MRVAIIDTQPQSPYNPSPQEQILSTAGWFPEVSGHLLLGLSSYEKGNSYTIT